MTEAELVRSLEARLDERDKSISDLHRALVLARCGLAEAHEAAVMRGVSVHWDILEQRLRTAHDAVHAVLQEGGHADGGSQGGSRARCRR